MIHFSNDDHSQQHQVASTTFTNTITVIKRSGETTSFDAEKITAAIAKAYLSVHGNDYHSQAMQEQIAQVRDAAVKSVCERALRFDRDIQIEEIQDNVELALMRGGAHKVARAYVTYRDRQAAKRDAAQQIALQNNPPEYTITKANGEIVKLDHQRTKQCIDDACFGLHDVDADLIYTETLKTIHPKIPEAKVNNAMVLAARSKVEMEPNYSFVAARLLLDDVYCKAFTCVMAKEVIASRSNLQGLYESYFAGYLQLAIDKELIDPRLRDDFDLPRLAQALDASRDLQFGLLGLQTLYDRYFIKTGETRIELPQAMWMRVAMGLAINEEDKTDKAIEFYQQLSSFDFMCSTPTLFNSGTLRPQLSSCYLTTIDDSLCSIYDSMKDNALLSKFAGGLGNDWTPVRAMGSHIKGTNGQSQGIIPFLKVANDTAVAVNQGGKRKGAICAYLEVWHLDVEEFLELRKNTGDDRRRTHDMNTACWIPDLFMKRLINEQALDTFLP